MLLYLDTSAFVPLLVAEPGTESCLAVWQQAEYVTSSRLLIAETAAALAQARRMQRLTAEQLSDCLTRADGLFSHINFVEVTAPVVDAARVLAVRHDLRGYDAVHLASSLLVGGADTAAASGDRRLLGVWTGLGFACVDTTGA